MAIDPDATLPENLKSHPTDTDKRYAIERLLEAIDDSAGQVWADELLTGAFGQKAGEVIKELDEAITTSVALAAARDKRAAAYGPAYERYLALKNVRQAYGSKSVQYRRIHRWRDGTSGDEAPATARNPAVGVESGEPE